MCALLPSACKNAFEEASIKNTNEAYLFDAKRAIDSQNYDLALEKLLALTPEFQQRRDVVGTTASAYAGRCGLNFLKLAQAITDHPNDKLFATLLSQFRYATTGKIADCKSAETTLRSLAPDNVFTSLTPDENVFLAIVSFAKIGAILGTYADVNDDGIADLIPAHTITFNACNTTILPEEMAKEIGVSMNIAVQALTASGSDIAGDSISNVSDACDAIGSSSNFCSAYSTAEIDDTMLHLVRSLIWSDDVVGVGTCGSGTNISTPACLCP